jgi:hypothetical protein
MSLKSFFRRALSLIVMTVLLFQLAACGTIMYPERKGQTSGKIDVGVAVLDGIGLLFFIIPGVIAYAVDFSNGTIYLPGTASVDGVDGQFSEWASFEVPEENMTRNGIELIIAAHTDVLDALSNPDSSVYEVNNLTEASQKMASLSH